jgi:hypothetical protein
VTPRTQAGRDAILRSSLTLLVQGHRADSIIQILSEVFDDHSTAYATRTGDYEEASRIQIIACFLESLDKFIDNYEPVKG